MKNINVLIVASSDMNGENDDRNIPNDVIDIKFPCLKYNGSAIKKDETFTNKSPRCIKCHYTEVEHKYGYPLYPLNPLKVILGEIGDTGKPLYGYSLYSDFWRNKSVIFERVKFLFGDDININYHSSTPQYVNDLSYLPTINKVNTIVKNNLKLKGKINYMKPYHFSCNLDEIHKQKDYKETKYDCIFVVSGGLGWLYTPENFKEMTKLLNYDKTKPAIIGNLWDIPLLEHTEYQGKYKFMNPINSCLNNNTSITSSKEMKKDINKCITNYTNILLHNNKFVESYEMLFRV